MKVLRKMTNNVKWPKDLNMWQMWVLVMTKYLKWQKLTKELLEQDKNSQWMNFKITFNID